MDVSVIIVNYKTVPLILNCLESLRVKTAGITYEVIVVDNNSGDDFQVRIQEHFPDVLCLPLPENVGFGRANNEGLRIAKGRNILFLNPDTVLLNNAVKILSDYLDAHPMVGACGGNLYDEEMNPAHSYRMYLPSLFWEVNIFLHGFPEKVVWGRNAQFNHTDSPLKVGFVTGADMMVPYRVLKLTGSFSPKFFMYYEETDLQYRMQQKGWKRRVISGPKILHLEGGSFQKMGLSPKRFAMSQTSYNYYIRKHFSGMRYVCFRLSLIVIRLTLFFNKGWNFKEKLHSYMLVVSGR